MNHEIIELDSSKSIQFYMDKLSKLQKVILGLYCSEITYPLITATKNISLGKDNIDLMQDYIDGQAVPLNSELFLLSNKIYDTYVLFYDFTDSVANLNNLSLLINSYVIYMMGCEDISVALSISCIDFIDIYSPDNMKMVVPYLSALALVKLPKIRYKDTLEKLVYYTDQLDIPIIVTYEDKFRLNLWHKEYEYQVIGSIEEIANTVGIANLLKGLEI